MASEKVTALVEEVKGLTVLELSELVHTLEEVFGVSAAAAVAGVYDGIRLENVGEDDASLVGELAHLSAERSDGDGAVEPERIPDGNHGFSEIEFSGIVAGDRLKIRRRIFDAEERNVVDLVIRHDVGVVSLAVGQRDHDARRPVHDVRVCDHEPRFIYDETTSEGVGFLLFLSVDEFVEHVLVGAVVDIPRHDPFRADIDHGGHDSFNGFDYFVAAS